MSIVTRSRATVGRRTLTAAMVAAGLTLVAGPAGAQSTDRIDEAAAALQTDPVFVAADAERRLDEAEVADLRTVVADAGTPIFIAVLPAAVAAEAGDDPTAVVEALGLATGLEGTYAVVVGDSFRAGSTLLDSGEAGDLATSAFDAHADEGTTAVLLDFVDRVRQAVAGTSAQGAGEPSTSAAEDDEGGGIGVLPIVLAVGAGGVGVFAWRRAKRRKEERAAWARAQEADRELLRAELSVVGDDVVRLEPEVALHPEAQVDYDAAVSRYRAAMAALDYADEPVDLVRVRRVLDEARYSMDRVRARIAGREPPPPPDALQRPGLHGEPAVGLDAQRDPVYVGYPGAFQAGWFGGGGSGLFTGLLLGSMLGGSWGGWGHGSTVIVDDRDGWRGDGGGGDWGGGGGDWGGGGDFGGGGGDFGGGGGGDF
jgi:hypothetical protein